ncbi:polysaccharide pyruvyl transferase family protein [Limosilactobacillus balticus]|uniref:polysaccharide pyruvyl transferase family protein n=1 Tax=Limosilactobacillus balticus TaxID=2759747 RepID=UPI001E29EFC8|nr:polysaccharide pyruvyl transferase family protein [Limosilactobacillus balticus]MCD7132166.1 polysaccharide pyruvyl transferase family protein [Limosilactobacillus balticus]
MKKIGILSMQRIYNYGSFLQAYALKKMIEDLGYNEIIFVDYHVGKPLINKNNGSTLAKVLDTIKLKVSFKNKIEYLMYKKHYGKKYLPLLGITNQYVYNPRLDLLIIGSDEVFNCVQSNTNVGFSPELFGYNNKAKVVASYAASFGNTTFEKLENYKVSDQVHRGFINNFDYLSVRDNNSALILHKMGIDSYIQNVDPVLVYDYMNSKIVKTSEVNVKEKYLLLYGYTGRFSLAECEVISNYAKENGLKIYCIGGLQHYCDKFIDCTPFEVLNYFKNAESVITDTFHGTIMSIINKKRFVTIIRKNGYGNSEKLTTLLEKLNLSSRKVEIKNDSLRKKLSEKINYQDIDEILTKERDKSNKYLQKIFSNI